MDTSLIQTFETKINMPGTQLPARSVAVKGIDSFILFSPIRFQNEQIEKLRGLGDVTDIVAPCLFHHLFIPQAIKLFPNARVWGVPGFREKRPDITWTHELTPDQWIHQHILEILPITGAPKYNEVEFFHPSSKTLIATDLCFNMRKPAGLMAPIILGAMGTFDGFAVSRLLKLMTKDKKALKKSLDKLFAWDFDRIIMAHGEIVESDGKNLLRAAMIKRGLY